LTAAGSLLRARHGHARVTYVELFFDLVFVFAITQLSHALLHHLDWAGALQALLLFLAVWWVWIYTAWATNFLDPDRAPVRLALFALMLAGLVLAAAIPGAFGDQGLIFALAYTFMQLGRAAFMVHGIGRADAALRRNFIRVGLWLAAAAPFWVAGGLVSGEARLALWALALGIEYLSPMVNFRIPGLGRSMTTDWTIDPGHMAERCALMVIVALGESVLITGATFAEAKLSAPVLAAFLLAFLAAVAMWWVYFHIGERRATRHLAGMADPGHMARLGYTYLHMPIIAGIIVSAVGVSQLLTHPAGEASPALAAVLLGGPALYLAGLGMFKRLTMGHLPLSHSVGLALVLLLTPVSTALPPLGLSAVATGLLILVAVWEHRSLGRSAT
jgi:low temperature requirement protein LtrA